jgi:hypothetical protein
MAANLSRKELLGKVYKMIPPMLESFHKGMLSSHWEILNTDWMTDKNQQVSSEE